MNKLVFTKCVFIYGFEIWGIGTLESPRVPVGTEYSALVRLFPPSGSHQAVTFQNRNLTFSDNNPISAAGADKEV